MTTTKQTQKANDLFEDMGGDEIDELSHIFYSKKAGTHACHKMPRPSARKQPQKIIPEILQQRVKDRNAKKQLKRALIAQKKAETLTLAQMRATTERRQRITACDYHANDRDNELIEYETLIQNSAQTNEL